MTKSPIEGYNHPAEETPPNPESQSQSQALSQSQSSNPESPFPHQSANTPDPRDGGNRTGLPQAPSRETKPFYPYPSAEGPGSSSSSCPFFPPDATVPSRRIKEPRSFWREKLRREGVETIKRGPGVPPRTNGPRYCLHGPLGSSPAPDALMRGDGGDCRGRRAGEVAVFFSWALCPVEHVGRVPRARREIRHVRKSMEIAIHTPTAIGTGHEALRRQRGSQPHTAHRTGS